MHVEVLSNVRICFRELAERIQAGTVMVNDVLNAYGTPEAPFGGVKQSGFGRVHGDEGLVDLCETRHVSYDRVALMRREPVWFPYRKGTFSAMSRARRLLMRSGSPVKKVFDLL